MLSLCGAHIFFCILLHITSRSSTSISTLSLYIADSRTVWGLRFYLFIYFFSTSKVVKGATNTIFIKIVKHWEIRYHRKYSSLSCIWISSYNLHHNRRSNIWKTHKHHHRKVSTRRFFSNNSNFRFHPTTRTSFDGLWADKTSWVSSKGATSNICVIGNSQ